MGDWKNVSWYVAIFCVTCLPLHGPLNKGKAPVVGFRGMSVLTSQLKRARKEAKIYAGLRVDLSGPAREREYGIGSLETKVYADCNRRFTFSNATDFINRHRIDIGKINIFELLEAGYHSVIDSKGLALQIQKLDAQGAILTPRYIRILSGIYQELVRKTQYDGHLFPSVEELSHGLTTLFQNSRERAIRGL